MPITDAKISSVLSVTFLSPRSTDPTYVRCSPHMSANSSCDMPRTSRNIRRLLASVVVSDTLGLRRDVVVLLMRDTIAANMEIVCSGDVYESTDDK
jgi:hypothetical protein